MFAVCTSIGAERLLNRYAQEKNQTYQLKMFGDFLHRFKLYCFEREKKRKKYSIHFTVLLSIQPSKDVVKSISWNISCALLFG